MGAEIKTVSWTNRVLKDLFKVSVFNATLLGTEKALKLAHKIIEAPQILENPDFDFENIGSIDASFSHLKLEYRKIFLDIIKLPTETVRPKFTLPEYLIPDKIRRKINNS